jgi:CubicO group peptidase (beta-lactamase class C family)
MKAVNGAALVLLVTATVAIAQPAPAPRPAPAATAPAPSLATRMDRLAKFYADNNQFMGTALVEQNGRILLNKAYGSANLEWSIPNTPATKFRLGSITKQFTAAAILLLEERGKLSIDDPVKKHMPDAPAAWDKVTLKHLLSHTAGLPNFTSFPDYMKTKYQSQTPVELIARFKDRALEFEPGTRWNYSNSGYIVLGHLIEKISGESYEKFVTANIFTPLGMKDSGYDSNTALIPRRATGYAPGPSGPQNADFVHMSIPHGAGALYSTTGDLLRWQRGLFGGKLLKPETVAKMTTAVLNDYGLGVQVRTVDGRKLVAHGGGIEGFNTQMQHYPAEKLTVITLANLNGPGADTLASKLASMALGDTVVLPSERKRVSVAAAALARTAGQYQLNATTVATVTVEGSRSFLQMGSGPRMEIYAAGQNRFFRAMPDGDLEFAGDAGAPAAELVMHPVNTGNAPTRAKRVSPEEVKRMASALEARRQAKTPDPRSEAALRKSIADVLAGTPDYESMAVGLANATRQQLPAIRNMLTGFGALKTVTFTEVGAGGMDVYKVEFEKGNVTWRIMMNDDGKIAGMNFQPA